MSHQLNGRTVCAALWGVGLGGRRDEEDGAFTGEIPTFSASGGEAGARSFRGEPPPRCRGSVDFSPDSSSLLVKALLRLVHEQKPF